MHVDIAYMRVIGLMSSKFDGSNADVHATANSDERNGVYVGII